MSLKIKLLLTLVLSVAAQSLIASSQKDSENFLKTSILIQNNLERTVLYMTQDAKAEIRKFGDITYAYSDTPGPDYNMMFNYDAVNTDTRSLTEALSYGQSKRYEFMLVRDQEKPSAEVKEILDRFNYKMIGTATKMAISHKDLNFTYVDLIVKEVTNQELLDTFCAIVDEAFNRQAGSSIAFMRRMTNLFQPTSELKLYVAYKIVDNQLIPAATAMLYLPNDHRHLAGHYSWAVKEEFRKQGIMSSLVKNCVLIAKQQGYSGSVAQCYDSSARLAQRIGFKAYGDLYLYVNAGN